MLAIAALAPDTARMTPLLRLLAPALILATGPATAALPIQRAEAVKAYPHDIGAFTEGLFFDRGRLFESTGLEGASSLREVRLSDGRVLRQRDLPATVFGEGIVAWRGKLVALEWQSGNGTLWSLDDFRPLGRFRYRPEGWGLTRDDRRLIMSDGTARLRFLDPITLAETGGVTVTAEGRPVRDLNELEWIDGEVWANIWQTDRIARIDPRDGRVKGWVDLSGLLTRAERARPGIDVANGIAWDARTRRVYVTGKNWPWLYHIRLAAPRRRN